MGYKMVKLPTIAWNNYSNKKREIEKDLRNILGKNVKVPLSRVITAHSFQPIYLDNHQIKQMRKNKKFVGWRFE